MQSHDLILQAARTAKECGLKVAIDLASFNIVAENLTFLRDLVREYVDIVFANEDEAKTFACEAEPLNALQAISELAELAVVKIGTKGALIKRGDEVVHVGIMAAARRVDTTGAGDFYAAGFLAGLCEGLSLRQCGTIGAITAGKVIEVVGTTFGEDAWKDIYRLVSKVKHEKYLFLDSDTGRTHETPDRNTKDASSGDVLFSSIPRSYRSGQSRARRLPPGTAEDSPRDPPSAGAGASGTCGGGMVSASSSVAPPLRDLERAGLRHAAVNPRPEPLAHAHVAAQPPEVLLRELRRGG